ncbi:MAG: HD domain-containing protein [Brevinema sp.]
MIRKNLILKLFEGFTMQRWNDQLRPTEFVEADKQAHALSLSYFLAKAAEKSEPVDMEELIEKTIFRYLERIVVTDIKPPVFQKIVADHHQYKELRKFVKETIFPYLYGLPEEFIKRFCHWCDTIDQETTLVDKIMDIARADATLWEFDLLKNTNPNAFGLVDLQEDMKRLKNKHLNIRTTLVTQLETKHIREENKEDLFTNENYSSYDQLISMFGQMRFQVRWAQLSREPKTTVLGHSFFVAVLSYFFSISADACKKRIYNNFFTGVFHDLPEVFTRDIISPLKTNIPGLGDMIKEIEHQEINKKFKMLIPDYLHEELFYFINDEFSNMTVENNVHVEHFGDIPKDKNEDKFNPRDGSLVRLADHLSAFVEADMALKNGSTALDFVNAKAKIIEKYFCKKISGLDVRPLFLDFQ